MSDKDADTPPLQNGDDFRYGGRNGAHDQRRQDSSGKDQTSNSSMDSNSRASAHGLFSTPPGITFSTEETEMPSYNPTVGPMSSLISRGRPETMCRAPTRQRELSFRARPPTHMGSDSSGDQVAFGFTGTDHEAICSNWSSCISPNTSVQAYPRSYRGVPDLPNAPSKSPHRSCPRRDYRWSVASNHPNSGRARINPVAAAPSMSSEMFGPYSNALFSSTFCDLQEEVVRNDGGKRKPDGI